MTVDIARDIDSGTTPQRYARGWHCLGLAADFRDGQPHGIDAFGQRLVVFAATDGKLRVLDAFCRHKGADLSDGTIKDGELACPFHDWRWSGSGACTRVPYAQSVPAAAVTRSWPTHEVNGHLLIWHDTEGSSPAPELAVPEIEGIGGDLWSGWAWNSVLIEGANCREIVDNNVDMAHFFYIHHAYPVYFKNIFDGHIATQLLHSKARPDVFPGGEDALLRSEASYYGPSYMINYLHNDFGDNTVEVVLINCHYPVDHDSFVLQWGVAVQRSPGMDDKTAAKLSEIFAAKFGEGFLEDVEIWKNKTRIDNPLLATEDGPVYQQRRWYEQFYVDIEKVEDDMTNRFECEVDTAHANTAWSREVAAIVESRTRNNAGR